MLDKRACQARISRTKFTCLWPPCVDLYVTYSLSRCCQNRKAASILFPASVCSCAVNLAPCNACNVIQGDPVHQQAWTPITLGLWCWSAWSQVPALRELVFLELELTAGSPRKSESEHGIDLDRVVYG